MFRAAAGDIVFRDEECGVVAACCVEAGSLYTLVDVMQKLADQSKFTSVWGKGDTTRQLWKVTDLSECLAWKPHGISDVMVVRM